MEKKNEGGSSSVLVTVLIIALLITTSLCGYFVGAYKFTSGMIKEQKENANNTTVKPEENEKEETKEAVTFTDSQLKEYVSYINPVSIGPSKKLYDASKVTASNLSAREKIEYIGTLVFAKHTSSSDYAYSILSESDVKNAVEKVYGPNTYEKTTFNLGCGDYTLRENEGKYYSKTGCGGMSEVSVANEVIDYTATKDKLEITTAYAFFVGNTKKPYKDLDLKTALDGDVRDTASFVKTNKDKLNHIVYVFESKDGKNYYFKEFTNNK